MVVALVVWRRDAESVRSLEIVKRLRCETDRHDRCTAIDARAGGRRHLDCAVDEEACPLNLAPTASTTAALALGDALAMALPDRARASGRRFRPSSSRGTLGKRLMRVERLMHTGDAAAVDADTPLRDVIYEMSRKGLGMTCVTDATARWSACSPTATCAA